MLAWVALLRTVVEGDCAPGGKHAMEASLSSLYSCARLTLTDWQIMWDARGGGGGGRTLTDGIGPKGL